MQETTYFDNIFQMNRRTTQDKFDNMQQQIDNFISYVKSQNLSPIEEVMLVYDRTKMLESAGNDTSLETRTLPDVVASGKAVCVGYTNLFNECISRLGYNTCAVESYIGQTSHMHSIVEINDDKYDIHGLYNFDPTFDSLETNQDRSLSYAFFGRTVEEINSLKNPRTPRGCSVAIMQGFTDNASYESFNQEIPTRTMNVVNGFFPSEENKQFLQTIYEEGKDRNNWQTLNNKFQYEVAQVGFRARRAENIPTEKLEQIIRNVRQVENPNLSQDELDRSMGQILEFNNNQFQRYFSDPRLLFKMQPQDFVSQEQFSDYLASFDNFMSGKSEEEIIQSIIEYENGQTQYVTHRLESIKDGETRVLMNGTFDSNYNFHQQLLNPMIESYASNSPYSNSSISKPEYFNLNIRSYTANSSNGNSFVIKDGNLDYLIGVDKYIKENSVKESVNINMKENNIVNIMNSAVEDDISIEPPTDDINALLEDTGEEVLDDDFLDISRLMNNNQVEVHKPVESGIENLMNDNGYVEQSRNIDDDISSLLDNSTEETYQEQRSEVEDIMNSASESSQDELSESQRIEMYNQYRAKQLSLITNMNSEEYIHSDFTMQGENLKTCTHTMEKITNDSRQVISQTDFENDELFRKCMLEPSLVDYAKTNPIISGKVQQQDNGMSGYMAFSETNNILTVNNAPIDYSNYIDTEIKKVDPTVFQQQMAEYQNQIQESYGYQKVYKNNNGFLNVLLLSSLVGFITGLISFVCIMVLKIFGN